MWAGIAARLNEEGCFANATKCATKWKNLKWVWRSIIDHNCKTGVEFKFCRFFEESMYGNKSGTRPSYTLASLDETCTFDCMYIFDELYNFIYHEITIYHEMIVNYFQ